MAMVREASPSSHNNEFFDNTTLRAMVLSSGTGPDESPACFSELLDSPFLLRRPGKNRKCLTRAGNFPLGRADPAFPGGQKRTAEDSPSRAFRAAIYRKEGTEGVRIA